MVDVRVGLEERSSRLTSFSVAKIEAFWRSVRSTVSSGPVGRREELLRHEARQEQRGDEGTSVSPMVSHFMRIAACTNAPYSVSSLPGLASPCRLGARSMTPLPISGAKITATSQRRSARCDHRKIENVYSPAELCEKPIGTKLEIVTSVPISIGAASVR